MRVNLASKKLILSVLVLLFVAAPVLSFNQRQVRIKADKLRNTPPENIIFIILDAARADHFSCYGYKKNTTPCMDSIARRGVVFLNHFSNAPSTRGALPTIFFSRYFSIPVFQIDGWRWNIRRLKPHLIFKKFDKQQIFLTDILSQHGYRTALFDNNADFLKDTYLVKKFDESFHFRVSRKHPRDENIISAVISWLKKNKEQKFFIYCHIMSPHAPYPPKVEDSELLGGESLSAIKKIREKLYECKNAKRWNQEELQIFQGLYDGNLKHTDKWIGILYDELKKLGLKDKTLVIITSDHGENLGEHGSLHHEWPPWDSVTHVPLIMVYPPSIPPGKEVRGLTESIDIMPTILDISKIELPRDKAMDGRSLLEVICNPRMGKEAVFTNKSIRTAEHKYIIGKNLLYDLRKDPDEKINIAEQEHLIREKLKAKFNKAMMPYKKRYEESKIEKSLDFPFYYPMRSYKFSPKGIFQKHDKTDPEFTILEKASSEKPWFLTVPSGQSRLFCLPTGCLPPPITLSAPLPNGTYRIYALLESPDKASLSPEKVGFKFRFDSQGPFVFPKHIKFFTKNRNSSYFYLDLGEIKVENNKFSLQISFLSPNKISYKIRHIKFVPAGSQEGIDKGPSKEEFQQKTEDLKSLGYL